MSGRTLRAALVRTAAYRGRSLRQLSQIVVRLPQLRQNSYTAWRRSQTAAALAYPADFADVVRTSSRSPTRLSLPSSLHLRGK